MSNPTPEEVFQYYKILLTEVLERHNPAGLNTIDVLLKQFPGKEHQVYIQICKKCGVPPEDPPTAENFVNGVPKRAIKAPPSDGKVSKWLTEHDFDRYAKQHHFMTMAWDEFLAISTKGRLIEVGVIPRHAEPLLTEIENTRKDLLPATPDAAKPESEKSAEEKEHEFKVGENCYTKVIKGDQEEEEWLNARITHVNDNDTYDIFVVDSKAHGVPPEAVNVPRAMLKKSSETVQTAVPEPRKSVRRPQIEPATRIRVFGLRSHTAYNGMFGSVLLYMPAERRYQVRLDTGDVIAIKQRNVEIFNAVPSEDMNAAMEVAMKKLREGGTVSAADEATLSDLLVKLIEESSKIDPVKLGQFAAGFFLAKKKIRVGQ